MGASANPVAGAGRGMVDPVVEAAQPQRRRGRRVEGKHIRKQCDARPGRAWVLVAACLVAGCAHAGPLPSHDALAPTATALPAKARPEQTAAGAPWLLDAPNLSGHFAVATAHRLSTTAAQAALQAGGTAVDALVAASFMLSVVQPQSTGIGGGGFAVVWPGMSGAPRAFDFREQAPAATRVADYLDEHGKAIAQRSRNHGLAVAVPGYVAGLWTLHQRYGKLPWRSLVTPAAEVAERGFAIGAELAAAIAASTEVLPESGRALFMPEGVPLAPGSLLRRPLLADTLARIANGGPDGFYSGDVAQDIVRTVQRAGGQLTRADLERYQVREMAPLQGEVFGLQALTMPQPSSGGAQVLAMAEMLQAWSEGPAGADFGASPWTAHALVEAMRRSFLLRLAFAGDADRPAGTLDEAFPRAARAALTASFDRQHATPSSTLQALTGASALPEQRTNTSHVAILDGRGMAVSSTHTINLYLGSGLITEKSGILLNNEMDDFTFSLSDANAFGLAGSAANLARPGARPVSSMAPLILLDHGQPSLVLGSPGGTRIPTTLMQVLTLHLRAGQTLSDAVAHARLHHQAWPDSAGVEEGTQGDVIAKVLQQRGHPVTRRGPWCNVQAVKRVPLPEGRSRFEAVSDPRAEGMAVAH